jgi:uncharacterized protein
MSDPHAARPLRRSSREITDPADIRAVLEQATVLYLGLHDEPAPYVLPVCFAHGQGVIYIHCAAEGTKLDLIRARPAVGFSAATEMTLVTGDTACAYGCQAASVVGTGRARLVTDEAERARALEAIMRHYAGPAADGLSYEPASVARTAVIAIHIDTLRGKRIE